MKLVTGSPTAQTAGSGATLVTVTGLSGNLNGTTLYTLTDCTSATGACVAPGSPSGLAVDQNGNVTTGTATAGTYHLQVTATDSGTEPQGASAFGTASTSTITVVVN
jgi:hypothetical protein